MTVTVGLFHADWSRRASVARPSAFKQLRHLTMLCDERETRRFSLVRCLFDLAITIEIVQRTRFGRKDTLG